MNSAPSNHFAPLSEKGSATVITAGILAVVGAITFAVVKLGVAANERARAQAVADLGSLAGASGDLAVATKIVASNGAVLVSATESGEAVDVAVAVGESQASARAERSYVPWNPIDTGPGVTDDLETTTIATIAPTLVPSTTRALIFATIPTASPTTRALVFPTIPTKRTIPPTTPPRTAATKKPTATASAPNAAGPTSSPGPTVLSSNRQAGLGAPAPPPPTAKLAPVPGTSPRR